jgi:hypothetical protein
MMEKFHMALQRELKEGMVFLRTIMHCFTGCSLEQFNTWCSATRKLVATKKARRKRNIGSWWPAEKEKSVSYISVIPAKNRCKKFERECPQLCFTSYAKLEKFIIIAKSAGMEPGLNKLMNGSTCNPFVSPYPAHCFDMLEFWKSVNGGKTD